ncbi:MAG: hypothetical protein U5O15_03975 [Candidatus Krumholzibacteriota bacterium]|nr:hypothetical protein [Candidatus Krumholzibacteriota bacterium]
MNIGEVVTRTTLLVIPVKYREVIHKRKCRERKKPDNNNNKISLEENFLNSALKLLEKNMHGISITDENKSLKEAITEDGASASFTNVAAKEIEIIPISRTNFVLIFSFRKITSTLS